MHTMWFLYMACINFESSSWFSRGLKRSLTVNRDRLVFFNLRHRRWTEVTVFTPVCLFVNSITEKLLDGFRRNLVGRVRSGPRIMPLDFGLGQKSNTAAMAAILKKYLNFCFCISTCFKWFPTKKHAKIIIAADFGTSGGYTHVKSISVSRNLVMTN